MKLLNRINPQSPILRVTGTGGLLLVILLLGACASPQSRIENNPAPYATLTPAVQAKIKQGKIDVGFTPQMVYYAWGKPDLKSETIDQKDKKEVWSYLGTRQDFGGYNYLTGRRIAKPVAYERATVTFINGKVSRFTP